jgi:CheY-like chemotaxis protein
VTANQTAWLAASAAVLTPGTTLASPSTAMDKTVLVVGREADAAGGDGPVAPIRGSLRAALQRVGYRVVEAEDGTAALSRLDHLLPDLILVAPPLADMNVPDLCTRVRRYSSRERIPMVLLAGRAAPEGRRAVHAGIDLTFPAEVNAVDLAVRLSGLF